MTESASKKTDVLNLRLEPEMAAEIQRIAEWRGTTASEIARELIRHGIAVERKLQAQELKRGYDYSKIDRKGSQGYLHLEAEWRPYTLDQLVQMREDEEKWMDFRP